MTGSAFFFHATKNHDRFWSIADIADWSIADIADWSIADIADWSIADIADWSIADIADWNRGYCKKKTKQTILFFKPFFFGMFPIAGWNGWNEQAGMAGMSRLEWLE
jgi:predicted phosphoadenosine phosphosulfate sulfurtransferase